MNLAFGGGIVIRRRAVSFALAAGIVIYVYNLKSMVDTMPTNDGRGGMSNSRRANHHPRPLPTCRPHWGIGVTMSSSSKDDGLGRTIRSDDDDDDVALAASRRRISRIYFYHARKAGGTMIRKYLQRVSSTYNINLHVMEYKHAHHDEEVGSRPDTLYVTNIRDPVERSISHFKYDARWGCHNLVKNASFVPSADNAMPFESWNDTGGFVKSKCDVPSTFVSCAVNCYLQAFSGNGCTNDGWYTEYNAAFDRLLRYNIVLVYSKFNDPDYARAVEGFFGGVTGFNVPSSMFCGEEARDANRRVPLRVSFERVLSLTRSNAMDNRLYRDLVTSCFDDMRERGEAYSFPTIDASRFVPQKNRTVID
jgi:hypothetical protein